MITKKTLVAHQPSYLPWLGYVEKLRISDVFVIMDDVKFSKNSMYARNYIKIKDKKVLLTVPTCNEDKNKKIKDVKIAGDSWRQNHLKKIIMAYSKSDFYDLYFPRIEKIYCKNWKWIFDLNLEFLFFIKDVFEIKSDLKIASHFDFEGDKNLRLVNYCNQFNANEYLFGENGKNYVDEKLFSENGVRVGFQKFKCPNERLSFLDYIFKYKIYDGFFGVIEYV